MKSKPRCPSSDHPSPPDLRSRKGTPASCYPHPVGCSRLATSEYFLSSTSELVVSNIQRAAACIRFVRHHGSLSRSSFRHCSKRVDPLREEWGKIVSPQVVVSPRSSRRGHADFHRSTSAREASITPKLPSPTAARICFVRPLFSWNSKPRHPKTTSCTTPLRLTPALKGRRIQPRAALGSRQHDREANSTLRHTPRPPAASALPSAAHPLLPDAPSPRNPHTMRFIKCLSCQLLPIKPRRSPDIKATTDDLRATFCIGWVRLSWHHSECVDPLGKITGSISLPHVAMALLAVRHRHTHFNPEFIDAHWATTSSQIALPPLLLLGGIVWPWAYLLPGSYRQ